LHRENSYQDFALFLPSIYYYTCAKAKAKAKRKEKKKKKIGGKK
jgi:hypothetical protein